MKIKLELDLRRDSDKYEWLCIRHAKQLAEFQDETLSELRSLLKHYDGEFPDELHDHIWKMRERLCGVCPHIMMENE